MMQESDVTPQLSKELQEIFETETVTVEEAMKRLQRFEPQERMRLFEQRREKFKLIKK